MMKALDDPGGFVRQVWFMPSGGQDTTGNLARYEAVPESASVPPAQPTIITGPVDLLYCRINDSNRPGCLCAEQMRMADSILNFASSFCKVSKWGMSESDPAAITTNGPVTGSCSSFTTCCSGAVQP